MKYESLGSRRSLNSVLFVNAVSVGTSINIQLFNPQDSFTLQLWLHRAAEHTNTLHRVHLLTADNTKLVLKNTYQHAANFYMQEGP